MFKAFFDENGRAIKRMGDIADTILNKLSPQYEQLSDAALREKTSEFRARLADGASLDDILPEAFAAVRVAAARTIGQRHFRVQLIGGQVLHSGKIAEAGTGEGKTLVGTLPTYLNALAGKGVHVITVNDYLVKRDASWMGAIHDFLGLSIGVIGNDTSYIYDPNFEGDPNFKHLRPCSRREAYQADITHGTNNEFGFDYLRDNMARNLEDVVQRDLHYAIVDEVDNILIDEARTPLIISGPATSTDNRYNMFAALVRTMTQEQAALRSRADDVMTAWDSIMAANKNAEPIAAFQEAMRKAAPQFAERLNYRQFAGVYRDELPAEFEKVLNEFNYNVDIKKRNTSLTPSGTTYVERALNIPITESIYDDKWSEAIQFLDNALKAESLYERDKEYVVRQGKDGLEVMIVDEFTGRIMEGRRWSDGLHQAVEAKESVPIQKENLTYATITLQNYFRMYKKLAGMTGTAKTEVEEFHKIYGLDVITIPTNRPMIRADETDLVYKTENGKFQAIVDEVLRRQFETDKDGYFVDRDGNRLDTNGYILDAKGLPTAKRSQKIARSTGQPILIGTASIAHSELLSDLMQRKGIKHEVLNAKQHEREANIIAQAGRPNAVTIATNMAGRGTDIILGGRPESYLEEELRRRELTDADKDTPAYQEAESAAQARWQATNAAIKQAGGLFIVGSERHESRRIDNQLRGRAGRQGDPGETRFYTSLEDELMRRFGTNRIGGLLERMGFGDDMPIEHKLITSSIEQAQQKVEGQNFDIRKHLVEYDDVMNTQRSVIYKDRRSILESENLRERVLAIIYGRIDEMVDEVVPPADIKRRRDEAESEPDFYSLFRRVVTLTQSQPLDITGVDINGLEKEEVEELITRLFEEKYGFTVDSLINLPNADIKELFHGIALKNYDEKEAEIGSDPMRMIERLVMLEALDKNWVEYLTPMEQLRQGIGLRAYAQKDPLVEYRTEAHRYWTELQRNIRHDIAAVIYNARLHVATPPPPVQEIGPDDSVTGEAAVHTHDNGRVNGKATNPKSANGRTANSNGRTAVAARPTALTETGDQMRNAAATAGKTATGPRRNDVKNIGPNDQCFCGSGKKYKKCHGSPVANVAG